MAGTIIMCSVCFMCAIMFFSIGVYARKLKKPMWFWSGTEVDAKKISDVESYNRENSVMWKWYSLWYFAAGAAEFFHTIASVAFLVLGCSVGIVILVSTYTKILKKYSI